MAKINHYIARKINSLLGVTEKDKIELYLEKYLDKDKSITLVDAGAHRGDFVDQIKKHYKIDKAILIEPIPDLAQFLKSKYSDDNIDVYQNALTEKDYESIDFQINEYQETSSILPFKSELKELANVNTRMAKKETVVTRTLDSIIHKAKLNSIDLIKIDVQGAEHLVLAGATNTVMSTKYIWIELSFKPLYIGSSVFHNIYSLMEQNGFVLLEISPGHRSPANELLQADALFGNPKFF